MTPQATGGFGARSRCAHHPRPALTERPSGCRPKLEGSVRMEIQQLPRTMLRVQYRLLRLPLTVFEAVTNRGAFAGSGTKEDDTRRSLVENVIGKAKQVVGTVFDSDSLLAEGRLQEAKAEQQREAGTREAIAEQEESTAERRFRERQEDVQEERARVAEEAAAREAEIERDREAALSRVEEEVADREAAEKRRTRARKTTVDHRATAARHERDEKKAGSARKKGAAAEARARAEELEKAQRRVSS